jgi:ankyrin repeat protein
VDLIECILDGGGNLCARTLWGDTAIHYAARSGTDKVMVFLLDEGIPVGKPKGNTSTHAQWYDRVP